MRKIEGLKLKVGKSLWLSDLLSDSYLMLTLSFSGSPKTKIDFTNYPLFSGVEIRHLAIHHEGSL